MELKIDIGDRKEVAAAIPLLQLILNATEPEITATFPNATKIAVTNTPEFLTAEQMAEQESLTPPVGPSIAQLQASGALPSPAEPKANTQGVILGYAGHPGMSTHGSAELDADAEKLDALMGPGASGPVFINQDPAAVFGGATLPTPGPTAADLGRPLTAAEAPAAVFGGGAAVPAPLAASIPPIATPAIVAPPAPATTAPITTTLGPASLGAGAASVELDKNGLPWDERIHAGTKTKLKGGEWKAKKSVDPALVASVEAELRARVVASPAPVAVVPAVPAAPAVDPAAVFGAAAPGVPPVPVIPTAPPVAPLAPAATVAPSAVADPATFEQLMPRITAAVTAGIMPPTAVGAACAAHGVASVVTLQQSPQFVPLVWATLKQQYPALA